MAISTVSNTNSGVQTSTAATGEQRSTGEMGKDQFLKLLVTQLKYQDPLKPMEDKEFISQMAQFSSLEQMQNLNANFSSMKAFSLMGKSISANYKDAQTGVQTNVIGVVEKVRMEKGNSYVTVGGHDIPIDEITDISDSSISKITDLMPIIGKSVNGKIAEQDGGIIDVSGKVDSVKKSGTLDYVSLNEVELNNVDVLMPAYELGYKKDYLTNNIGKEVTIIATDKSGKNVHVTAVLDEMKENGDKFDVKLSKVEVPIDNLVGLSQGT